MLIHTPTIYHTGTHLLIDHVLRRLQLFNHASGNHHVHWHLDRISDMGDATGGDFRFSCLRHPRRVAESWKRRLPNNPTRTVEEFNYEWDRMINFYHPTMSAYIHPDHECRDEDVACMAELTGLDLTCDWPLGKRSGAMKNTVSIGLDMCPEVPQEFIDFYYETIDPGLIAGVSVADTS